MTISEWLRKNILENLGIQTPIETTNFEETANSVKSWWCPFLQKCFNRLIIGHLRYGNIITRKTQFDYIKYVRQKMNIYEETGNTECLLDIANVVAIEFCFPTHKNSHFLAEDDSFHAEEKK